jgi:hypothetical protein
MFNIATDCVSQLYTAGRLIAVAAGYSYAAQAAVTLGGTPTAVGPSADIVMSS